jgi:hypothetical protein
MHSASTVLDCRRALAFKPEVCVKLAGVYVRKGTNVTLPYVDLNFKG